MVKNQIKIPISYLMKLYEVTKAPVIHLKMGRWDLVEEDYKKLQEVLVDMKAYLPADIVETLERKISDIESFIKGELEMETIMFFAGIYEYILMKITKYKTEKLPEEVETEFNLDLSFIEGTTLHQSLYDFPEAKERVYNIIDTLDRYTKYPHPRIAEYASKLIYYLEQEDPYWAMYWSERFTVRINMILGEEVW